VTDPDSTTGAPPATLVTREELLAQAVAALTAAARLTVPVRELDEAATAAAGHPVWTESDRREPADWPAFVTQALAAAAANIGGIEAVLAGRPGSWEADGVRNLLRATVGTDEEFLLEHRTEPLVVDLYVEEILTDLGISQVYTAAQDELSARWHTIGLPTHTAEPGEVWEDTRAAVAALPEATEDQERQAEELDALMDRLEVQRHADWTAYGTALQAAVEAAAAQLPGLTVPVVVTVDLDGYPEQPAVHSGSWTVVDQLVTQARGITPPPGDGRPPLQRLTDVTGS